VIVNPTSLTITKVGGQYSIYNSWFEFDSFSDIGTMENCRSRSSSFKLLRADESGEFMFI
jgi:hypothetical protein